MAVHPASIPRQCRLPFPEWAAPQREVWDAPAPYLRISKECLVALLGHSERDRPSSFSESVSPAQARNCLELRRAQPSQTEASPQESPYFPQTGQQVQAIQAAFEQAPPGPVPSPACGPQDRKADASARGPNAILDWVGWIGSSPRALSARKNCVSYPWYGRFTRKMPRRSGAAPLCARAGSDAP